MRTRPTHTDRTRRAAKLLFVGLLLASVSASPSAEQETSGFRIIVRADNSIERAPRTYVARIFLGQSANWTNGSKIRPVDQSLTSPVRKEFSSAVLRQSILAVTSYWRQQLFAGRSAPPPVKGTDAEVVEFVSSTPGAIGYVSANAPLPKEVRAIEVSDAR